MDGEGRFSGRVAIVTGGSRGIGAEVARRLGAGGATVAVAYRSDLASAECIVGALKNAGAKAAAFQVDVASPEDCEALVRACISSFGRLDILVNAAAKPGGQATPPKLAEITDALFFDDVKVPWDRVFIDGSVEMCQKQFHATPAHVYQNYQAMIRLKVKLQFLMGIAHRTTQTNGITQFPQVREILGQLAAEAAMVDAFVNAMEAKGTQAGPYFVPDRHMLYSAQVLTQQMYPKILNSLRALAGERGWPVLDCAPRGGRSCAACWS
mgnify:CR=1 FL=1